MQLLPGCSKEKQWLVKRGNSWPDTWLSIITKWTVWASGREDWLQYWQPSVCVCIYKSTAHGYICVPVVKTHGCGHVLVYIGTNMHLYKSSHTIVHTHNYLAKPCSFPLGEIVAVLIYHSLHWVYTCSLLHWWGFHFSSSQTKQKLRWRSCVCSVLRMSRSVLAGWQPSDSSRYVNQGYGGCISHRTTGCGSILAQKRYVVSTIKSELTYQV